MNMVHGTLLVEAGGGDGEGQAVVPERRTRLDASAGTTHTSRSGTSRRRGTDPEVGGTSRVEFSLRADGVACPTCVTNIESLLDRLPGVDRVEANYGAERVTVDFDPSQVGIDGDATRDRARRLPGRGDGASPGRPRPRTRRRSLGARRSATSPDA